MVPGGWGVRCPQELALEPECEWPRTPALLSPGPAPATPGEAVLPWNPPKGPDCCQTHQWAEPTLSPLVAESETGPALKMGPESCGPLAPEAEICVQGRWEARRFMLPAGLTGEALPPSGSPREEEAREAITRSLALALGTQPHVPAE